MLEEYAKRSHFPNMRHFIDDGWSGTRWDRPSFIEMISLVKEGKVGTIIVKDMSRLAAPYLLRNISFTTDATLARAFAYLWKRIDLHLADKGGVSARCTPSEATETTPKFTYRQLQGQEGNRLAATMSIRTANNREWAFMLLIKPLHPVLTELSILQQ